ncbi:metallophosphoesterase [Clostridium gasigenes]|uniref:metallophosphoesterase family protein n=1 Tax=Clostridium gasigenes TaxID=94869 RepID=UPI001C0AFD2D|nr:metallophosphoesterase [Clostridium gasigenes]MBU3133404.1 metallophosphoesterase [Clostridium gasigenes]
MYYKKLMDIVNSKDGISNGIDMKFIQNFDKCIKDETTERERLKLNPIKMSNEMNSSQRVIMNFFAIGAKIGLFKARAFYNCTCNQHFEIYNLEYIECENDCDLDKSKKRSSIYVYFQLLFDIEECSFEDYGDYQVDYILEDDLGNFQGTLNEYDDIIGKEEANNLLCCKENKVNEFKNIKIAHISDLHFGSQHNIGIDNKARLRSIDDIQSEIFESFKEVISKEQINYLIISGDLTTKNEVIGFEEFNESIEDIDMDKNNIYIVPGNHECDRSQSKEIAQFAYFISYTGKFYTPFAKNNYIMDRENKVFIYGFNSVNYKNDDGKELFYIKDEEFKRLDSLCSNLSTDVEKFSEYDKIAVLHNNLLPHPTIEIEEYAEILNLYTIKYKLSNLGFKLVCSGHKHEELIEKHTIYYEGGDGKDIVLISAPSLCGNVYNNKNGFQLINLFKDNEDKLIKLEIEKYELDTLRKLKKVKSLEIKMNNYNT